MSSLSTSSGQIVEGVYEIALALKDAFFEKVAVGDTCESDGTALDF